ncbi:hypothetical protein AURDEDRAFT_132034 [Auricularia subglabra TFB-10046 SS5]|uniref:Uncharacterized protein n=1 Tax=Auricularia subglabra (strain TFB-10046 / SS5) TaxID=717982 RepID=J0WK66_AURST|nr:hypothetical protein AURDEDRAFT_132034 [Auricularia subglabra TFB-10046 SS5]
MDLEPSASETNQTPVDVDISDEEPTPMTETEIDALPRRESPSYRSPGQMPPLNDPACRSHDHEETEYMDYQELKTLSKSLFFDHRRALGPGEVRVCALQPLNDDNRVGPSDTGKHTPFKRGHRRNWYGYDAVPIRTLSIC